MASSLGKAALRKRLDSYWRLELLCAAWIPATAVFLLVTFNQKIGPVCILCSVPTVAMLLVGGWYWRTRHCALNGDDRIFKKAIPWIARLQLPLIIAVLLATVVCVVDVTFARISLSTGDRIVAVVMTVMAVLEYINYYHRQLQHFDHYPDFLRLVTGNGFRRSHMSRDLRRHRQINRANARTRSGQPVLGQSFAPRALLASANALILCGLRSVRQ